MREYTQPAARSLPGDAGASRRRCARVRNTALSRACPKAKWGPFPQALKGLTVPCEVRHYHGDHCLRPSAPSDGPDPGRRKVTAQRDRDWSPRTGCDRNESAESMTIWSLTLPQVAATLAATAVRLRYVRPRRSAPGRRPIAQLMLTTSILGPVFTEHFAPRMLPDLRPAKAA